MWQANMQAAALEVCREGVASKFVGSLRRTEIEGAGCLARNSKGGSVVGRQRPLLVRAALPTWAGEDLRKKSLLRFSGWYAMAGSPGVVVTTTFILACAVLWRWALGRLFLLICPACTTSAIPRLRRSRFGQI